MAVRRNSPSYNQPAKVCCSTPAFHTDPGITLDAQSMMFKREPSPFDSSPLNTSNLSTNSPRAFWKGRDPTSPSRFSESENVYDSGFASPRRNSLEKLKQASRVKNSSMFERQQEYDPASAPLNVERPLAGGRPLSTQVPGNAFNGEGLEGMRKANPEFRSHRRGQSLTKIPVAASAPTSPMKQVPYESGRTSNASVFNPDSSVFSEGNSDVRTSTPRPLRRQAKSVTFDQGPPQINEYEMVTPDPSSVASGSREGSYDDYDSDSDAYNDEHGEREDSFDESLEDTEKTPVVLPGDWPGMSPDNANTELAHNFEDPFDTRDGSPSPSAKATGARPSHKRTDSSDRPLPPIPGIAAAAERAGNQQRNLPSPPRAALISKAEILDMKKRSSLSMEDRFKLMGLRDASPETSPRKKTDGRAARVEKLQKAHVKDQGLGIQVHEDETASAEAGAEMDSVPIISRESVLRKVKSQHLRPMPHHEDNAYDGSGYGDYQLANLDPDVPIPSREVSSEFEDDPDPIKQEDEDGSEVDVYSIPELYSVERSPSRMENHEREGSVIRRTSGESNNGHATSSSEDDGPLTPKLDEATGDQLNEPSLPWLKDEEKDSQRSSLPEFESLMDDDDFRTGLGSFMSREEDPVQSPAAVQSTGLTAPKLEPAHEFLQRPSKSLSELQSSQSSSEASSEEPVEDVEIEDNTPDSPGSVIHHPTAVEPEECTSPTIPERASTIKGSGLKARPSLSHADAAALASQRGQAADEDIPPVPPLPARSPRRNSSIGVADAGESGEIDETGTRKPSFQGISLGGLGGSDEFGLGMELDHEFDRLIEAEKKGYKMRENTKVVVARNRDFSDEKPPPSPTKEEEGQTRGTRSAGSSPRKSNSLSKPWTTEPYQAKARRKSIRTASGTRKTVPASGPVPPLPGQESATISEEAARDSYEEPDWEEGAERGRLFVKVMGVKDLDLPIPKNERTQFQLTLDNGLHCVTTSWLDLAKSAPIGQEFELVVLNDLEFQLTLQTKLTPPPKPAQSVASSVSRSPTKAAAKGAKKGGFSSLLMSPKKRKEAEARRLAEEREREAQQQRERDAAASRAQASRSKTASTAWDLLHELVAPDGSFARAYISLKSFEESCFGKAMVVDVPAYNEWAAEQDPSVIESMRSKRGRNGNDTVRRPPYQVGKLQLQLLYVPKPKGAKDEDLPRSLNGAVREMEKCREAVDRKHEGSLSQQGGDCPVGFLIDRL